jgi:ribonuclease HI
MPKKNFYAVKAGRKPGIYRQWSGENGAEIQIKGYVGAVYKGFETLSEAKAWLDGHHAAQKRMPLGLFSEQTEANRIEQVSNQASLKEKRGATHNTHINPQQALAEGKVVIYTDGGCISNPGPGGYGAVILEQGKRMEISAGYRQTTNNRMELRACIAALETLKQPASVVLYSDSRYVVNGIEQGWAKRWRAQNWMRDKKNRAINADLWARLLDLCNRHQVQFEWVKGHAGNPENERCDQLSTSAALKPTLPPDIESKVIPGSSAF